MYKFSRGKNLEIISFRYKVTEVIKTIKSINVKKIIKVILAFLAIKAIKGFIVSMVLYILSFGKQIFISTTFIFNFFSGY